MRNLRHALGLRRGVAALAIGLFVYGFGQELWFRYLPEYLRFLGATPILLGLFGTLKDFLDAAYAYPGGAIADRLGSRSGKSASRLARPSSSIAPIPPLAAGRWVSTTRSGVSRSPAPRPWAACSGRSGRR